MHLAVIAPLTIPIHLRYFITKTWGVTMTQAMRDSRPCLVSQSLSSNCIVVLALGVADNLKEAKAMIKNMKDAWTWRIVWHGVTIEWRGEYCQSMTTRGKVESQLVTCICMGFYLEQIFRHQAHYTTVLWRSYTHHAQTSKMCIESLLLNSALALQRFYYNR